MATRALARPDPWVRWRSPPATASVRQWHMRHPLRQRVQQRVWDCVLAAWAAARASLLLPVC